MHGTLIYVSLSGIKHTSENYVLADENLKLKEIMFGVFK